MKTIELKNNELLFFLKHINREINKAEQNGATVNKLTFLYELKNKFKG